MMQFALDIPPRHTGARRGCKRLQRQDAGGKNQERSGAKQTTGRWRKTHDPRTRSGTVRNNTVRNNTVRYGTIIL